MQFCVCTIVDKWTRTFRQYWCSSQREFRGIALFLLATKEKCEEEIQRFLVSHTKYVWLMICPHGLNSNFECHQEHVGGATTYLDRSAHLAQCRQLFWKMSMSIQPQAPTWKRHISNPTNSRPTLACSCPLLEVMCLLRFLYSTMANTHVPSSVFWCCVSPGLRPISRSYQ